MRLSQYHQSRVLGEAAPQEEAAMAAMGLLEEVYRLPLVPPSEASRRRITQALAASRILEATSAAVR